MTSSARIATKSNSPAEALRGFSAPTAAGISIAVLVIHIITNFITPYGFHRDEFLYLAMGEHLRIWQMDFPPFIALLGRVSHALFGTSLAGIRLGPAFAHAGLVYAATLATALFGGRRSAQMLAALTVALGGNFLRAGAMLQPVVFDQLWWTLALLALTLRIREDDPKHWLGIGLFLGLGALTKFSVAFIAAGFVVALFATSLRKDLLTKWPWLALAIATVVGHPSITGQIFLHWPVFQQFADLKKDQLSHVGPLSFITGQLPAGPVFFLALGGMVWLFVAGRRGRSMGSESPKN
ncbi:MAG: glycosyltransferase family 39 protein, partial [Gemmatimonadaceae bacterium]